MVHTWHRLLLAPKSREERHRRQEYILNMLLVSVTALSLLALSTLLVEKILGHRAEENTSLLFMAVLSVFFASLLFWSRRFSYRPVSYIFIASFFLVATYPLYVWGILLPQGVLTYAVVIFMAGALAGTIGAIAVAFASSVSLVILVYLARANYIVPELSWMEQSGGYVDAVVFGLTFLVLALIVWLSDSEIKRSMNRVKESESALKRERDSLDAKVRARTAELQKMQVEKMRELQRFAEFGRYTSTLLHDLANPLTAISLNIDQMQDKQHSDLLKRTKEGLRYIEEYIAAARRQISNQRDTKTFDVAQEIRRIEAFLSGKAVHDHVAVQLNLKKGLIMKADNVRFCQVVACLMANAIDAYDGVDKPDKIVEVTLKRIDGYAEIQVRDRGKGIPPENMKRLFEPFYTTKTVDRGLGIGLSITKQIVEEDLGGRITVASDKHGGTRFTVKVPVI